MSTPTDEPANVAYPYQAEPSPGMPAPPSGNVPASVAAVNPDNPPWGLPAAIGVLCASLALLVFVPVFIVVPYVFWRGVNMQTIGEFLQTDKTAIVLSLIATLPAHLLTLALVWVVVTGIGKRPFWRTLGWSWSPRVGLWSSVGLALGLYVLGILIFKIFGDQETALVRLLNSSAAARYSIVVMATLTAPLVEEVVYRGVLYPALQRRVGMLWGVAGVMIIFALIHVPQYYPSFGAISTIGVLSLSLTLLRAYSGRLLPCVVVHTIFNGLASVAILLEPYFKDVPKVTDEPATSALLPYIGHVAAQLVSIFF
ncbi:MAG TPA: type II CAAX endopeptidase family protein [Pyrinomonadaceae bacterium]|nr:type II CAAX endopeptidase family protein [Pyrinomonadaceae bacterium]